MNGLYSNLRSGHRAIPATYRTENPMPTHATRLPTAVRAAADIVASVVTAAILGIILAAAHAPVGLSASAAGIALAGLLAVRARDWRQTGGRDEPARASD